MDYLHLICIGICKKLLNLWCNDKVSVRLPFRKKQIISESLIALKTYIPVEFQRKPRSLRYLPDWKAMEFRQLLLYTGPVILKTVLAPNVYENFLCLHVAVTILCSPQLSSNETNLFYTEELIQYFVNTFKFIYGSHHVSHNVHGLLHIVDDVRKFGVLDRFSCFKFENYNQILKKLIRKKDKPLQQISRRLEEANYCKLESKVDNSLRTDQVVLKTRHNLGPIIDSCTDIQYRSIIYHKLTLSVLGKGNKCCCLFNNSIVLILNIAYQNMLQRYVIVGKEFLNKVNVYESPCESSLLRIYKVSTLSEVKCWSIHEIKAKYFLYIHQKKYFAFPMFHTEQDERPVI